MPIDPIRMKALEEAWELVNSASHEERSELFKTEIQNFETLKAELEEPDNRFNPLVTRAYYAMDLLEGFARRLTGYNPGWIPYKFLEHCCQNSGRPTKYNTDLRELNCFFIDQMVKRGASETQAMKLLMRLRGDGAMSSGHLRELRDTYGDYKKIYKKSDHEFPFLFQSHLIARFLEFSISNLEGDEIAAQKAVDAFRSFFQEVIDLMKFSHEVIAKHDRSYPDIFGCVIDWIKAEYEDPLDYFYGHETHQTVPIAQRRRALTEYLNTVQYFFEHPVK